MILIQGIHGSRLYNLHHEKSDWDYWSVYSNVAGKKPKQIKQTIKDGVDRTEMNLSTFQLYCDRASHQCLELCFSTHNTVNLIKDYTDNFYVNTANFVHLYDRTIRAFWGRGDRKSQQHAMRMALNMQDGVRYGRFDPTLTQLQRETILESTNEQLESWLNKTLSNI